MKDITYKKFFYKPVKINFLKNYCHINGFLFKDSFKLKKNTYYLLNNSNNLCLKKSFLKTFFSLLLKYIDGVCYGYKNIIFIKGKGLRLQLKKRKSGIKIYLKLGYSHKILFKMPKNCWALLTGRRRTLFLFTYNYNVLRLIVQKIKIYYPIGLYKIRGFFEKHQIIKLKKGKSSRLGSRLY